MGVNVLYLVLSAVGIIVGIAATVYVAWLILRTIARMIDFAFHDTVLRIVLWVSVAVSGLYGGFLFLAGTLHSRRFPYGEWGYGGYSDKASAWIHWGDQYQDLPRTRMPAQPASLSVEDYLWAGFISLVVIGALTGVIFLIKCYYDDLYAEDETDEVVDEQLESYT